MSVSLSEGQAKKDMRRLSVIVPTLNRTEELSKMLYSVLEQSYLPLEVIIVDQSTNQDTAQLSEHFENSFNRLGVELKYCHLSSPGITLARNEGLKHAIGEYVTFLDNDVVLEPEYLAEIEKTIDKYGALVVQGRVTNYYDRYKPILYWIMRIFGLSSPSKASGEVYPSFGNVLPVRFETDVPCMWASGCNHTIKTSVARELNYDENLIAYGLGEDVDMTYRVYKRYPGSIWANPRARLAHLESQNQRLGNRKAIYMEAVHRRYLFHKNITPSFGANLIFAWSRLGVFIVSLLRFIQKPRLFMVNLRNLGCTISAEYFAFRHRKDISQGNLTFFHRWFLVVKQP